MSDLIRTMRRSPSYNGVDPWQRGDRVDRTPGAPQRKLKSVSRGSEAFASPRHMPPPPPPPPPGNRRSIFTRLKNFFTRRKAA